MGFSVSEVDQMRAPDPLGIHRRMVREALADAVPQERKKSERERPKLEPAIPFIDTILENDLTAPRKQRHTAHRIYDRLRLEKPEIEVAETTVRKYVREKKLQVGLIHREIFVPQSYAWGQEGQVDWYEMAAVLGGEQQTVQMFCLRSMASAGAFHQAYGTYASVSTRQSAGVFGSSRIGIPLFRRRFSCASV